MTKSREIRCFDYVNHPYVPVRDALVSRSKGLDDRDNPHRWWNTTGDWKKAAPAG